MLNIGDITIDPEFEALIPPLSDDERTQLVANIERDGFRDPLVVWMNHSVLLDGHNRFRIWEERFQNDENREPEIKELKFATPDDAKTWIIQNQLGRRNLPDAVRVQLALKLKPMIEAKAKANQQAAGGALPQKSAEAVETRKEIAKAAGVSHDTVRKVETVLLLGGETLQQAMLNGKTSINAAAKVATMPKAAQQELIDAGPKAVKEAATTSIGTPPETPPLKPVKADEVTSLGVEIQKKVRLLLNRIKRSSKGAINELPGLQLKLFQLGSDCRTLAEEIGQKAGL